MCFLISTASETPHGSSPEPKEVGASSTGKEPPSVCWMALVLCVCVCVHARVWVCGCDCTYMCISTRREVLLGHEGQRWVGFSLGSLGSV